MKDKLFSLERQGFFTRIGQHNLTKNFFGWTEQKIMFFQPISDGHISEIKQE